MTTKKSLLEEGLQKRLFERIFGHLVTNETAALDLEIQKGKDAVPAVDIVNLLGPKKESLLHIAIALACRRTGVDVQMKGQVQDMAEFLLDKGAKPDIQDVNGDTALHECAIWGNLTLAKLLMEYGSKPGKGLHRCSKKGKGLHSCTFLRNCKGFTPLHVSAVYGHVEFTKMLISYMVNVNCFDGEECKKERTPLHICAEYGHVKVAELLLSKGAYINSLDENDHTPLMAAVSAPTEDMVMFLACEKANIWCKGLDGLTAKGLALQQLRNDIVEILAAIEMTQKCEAFLLLKKGHALPHDVLEMIVCYIRGATI